MIIATNPTPEELKKLQNLVAYHASAGSIGAIVGFVSHSVPVCAKEPELDKRLLSA
jgi:hypothetical protein